MISQYEYEIEYHYEHQNTLTITMTLIRNFEKQNECVVKVKLNVFQSDSESHS